MDHPLIDLINARIKEAEEAGDFKDLPGAGKPLPKVDDPENYLVNKVMREQGAVPPFVAMARELKALRAELMETHDRSQRHDMMKKISMMEASIEISRKAWSK